MKRVTGLIVSIGCDMVGWALGGASIASYPRYPRYGQLAGQRNELFLNSAFAAEQAVAPFLEGLGPKAGLLLFQFPPQHPQSLGSPRLFADRLQQFLSALPRGPLYGVELRNSGFFTVHYREALRDASALHCVNVHPAMPSPQRQWEMAVDSADQAVFVRRVQTKESGCRNLRRNFDSDVRNRRNSKGLRLPLSDPID